MFDVWNSFSANRKSDRDYTSELDPLLDRSIACEIKHARLSLGMRQAYDYASIVSEREDLHLSEFSAQRSGLQVELFVQLQIRSEMQQYGIPRQFELGTAHFLVAHHYKHRSVGVAHNSADISHISRDGGLLAWQRTAIRPEAD